TDTWTDSAAECPPSIARGGAIPPATTHRSPCLSPPSPGGGRSATAPPPTDAHPRRQEGEHRGHQHRLRTHRYPGPRSLGAAARLPGCPDLGRRPDPGPLRQPGPGNGAPAVLAAQDPDAA